MKLGQLCSGVKLVFQTLQIICRHVNVNQSSVFTNLETGARFSRPTEGRMKDDYPDYYSEDYSTHVSADMNYPQPVYREIRSFQSTYISFCKYKYISLCQHKYIFLFYSLYYNKYISMSLCLSRYISLFLCIYIFISVLLCLYKYIYISLCL